MLLIVTDTNSVTWLYVAEHGDVPAQGSVLGSPAPANGGRVIRYNLTSGSSTPQVVAIRGTGPGQFISPDGMVMNTNGQLFVADRYQDKVDELSIDATTGAGTRINGFGSSGTGAADEMHGPLGLARDSNGDIYVSEHGDGNPGANGNMVSKYHFIAGTGWARQWRVAGAGFSTPYGIAVSGTELYVSDGFNNRVQTLSTTDGSVIRNWSVGSGIIPLGLSIDGTNLWVGEATGDFNGTQRVSRRNATTGVSDLTIGTAGTGNLQFALPFHPVRNTATNRLYVSDYHNNRVQEIDLTPASTDTTPPTVAVVGGSGATSPTTFTVSFSETVTGVAAGAFTASGTGVTAGTITVTPVSGSVYTVTVPFTGGTSGSINLVLNGTANTTIKDTSNNAYAGAATSGSSNTATYTITSGTGSSRTPTTLPAGPAISSFAIDLSSITHTGDPAAFGSSAVMVVTFDSAVTGVDQTDFSISGPARITGVTPVNSTQYRVAFDFTNTVGAYAQVAIKTSGTGITAGANAFYGQGVTATDVAPIQNGSTFISPPSVTAFTAGTPTGSSVNFTLTFSAAVAGVSADDFLVVKTGAVVPTVNTPTTSNGGTTWTIPVSFTGTTGAFELFLAGGATTNITTVASPVTWYNGSGTSPSAVLDLGGGGTGSAPTIAAQSTSGTAGTPISYQVVATGATSFTSASLPANGLSISSSGLITGTPTAAATMTPVVTATNTNGSNSAPVTITIAAASVGAPVVSNATVAGQVGTAITAVQVSATNSPTSFSASGLATYGLAISNSGLITGTPTATASGATVSVTATNGGGTSSAATITLNISAGGTAPTIAAQSTSGTAGTPVSYQVVATGATSFSSANLPANGLSISSSGLITGTPTAAATMTPVITATNANGSNSATVTITIAASGTAPTMANQTAPGTRNSVFSYQVAATGATSYSVVGSPALPNGLGFSLTTPGLITGTPTASGTTVVTIRASNSFGNTDRTVTFNIAADTTAPTVSSFTIASSTSSSVTYQIVFSEVVSGVDVADFTASRAGSTGGTATLGALTAGLDGKTYTQVVNFTGVGGTVGLALNATGTAIVDTAANALVGGSTAPTFTVVTGAPVITSVGVSGQVGFAITPVTVQATNSPTSFSAPGLSAYNLTISTSGQIAGTPTQGASNVSIPVTATNVTGSGTGTIILNITGSSSSGGGSGGSGGGGGGTTIQSQTISFTSASAGTVGTPITLSASTTSGLSPIIFSLVSGPATLSGNILTPTAAGNVVVSAIQAGNSAYLSGFAQQTITVKGAQTISFTAPSASVNQAVTLSATSSAGLPVTFSLVSGDATLSGSTLTPRSAGTIVVRASQAGTDTVSAASADVTITVPKAAQSITFAALNNVPVSSGPIFLSASASSSLPVSFSVSGPATLSGNTLTLTGTPGSVTVRANQAGNASFNAAAEVARTFVVSPVGQQVFIGNAGPDTFAIVLAANGRDGLFITRISATGEVIVVHFTVNADGSFNASGTSAGVASEAITLNLTPATAAAGQTRTISGRVVNGAVTGSIVELGTSFNATAAPATGSSASLAGAYTASVPGSAGGDTYIVAGSDGRVFAVAVTPTGTISGMGTISADGTISVTTSGGGTIAATVDAANGTVAGTVTNGGVTSTIRGLSEGTEPTDRLVNVSSRLRFAAGDNTRTVIAGFVIAGTESKKVLVRAVGPGLTGFNVQGALANPKLQLFNSSSVMVGENDDWSNNADVIASGDAVAAFRLASGSADAAMVATLAPGAYTAVVTGGTGSGVVLVEVYDASSNTPLAAQHLVNISTRGFVDTGDGNLIAGFVVTGNQPKKVLVRGIGPSLAQFGVTGVVADPTLRIVASGSSTVIAQNNDWATAQPVNSSQVVATQAELAAAMAAAGAFPLNATARDAAILITLNPGAYSAVVAGANNTTGAGLVEVYEVSN